MRPKVLLYQVTSMTLHKNNLDELRVLLELKDAVSVCSRYKLLKVNIVAALHYNLIVDFLDTKYLFLLRERC